MPDMLNVESVIAMLPAISQTPLKSVAKFLTVSSSNKKTVQCTYKKQDAAAIEKAAKAAKLKISDSVFGGFRGFSAQADGTVVIFREEDISIEQVFEKLPKNVAKALQPIKNLFAVHSANGNSIECVYNRDNSTDVESAAFSCGVQMSANVRTQHRGFKVQAGPVEIIFRETGKKIGGAVNRNSLGRVLNNAAELATITSLFKEIKTPQDTGIDLFINDPAAFNEWKPTFDMTKTVLLQALGISSLNGYAVLHDATDSSNFSKAVAAFLSKTKGMFTSKDAWNPADMWIIKKSETSRIVKEILASTESQPKICASLVKDIFNREFKAKNLFPVSLKKLGKQPHFEISNLEPLNSGYDIDIQQFNCNFIENPADLELGNNPVNTMSNEIGLFIFNNKTNNCPITMQVRGFPHKYGIAQTEITTDGSGSGGRLGKISTAIIDQILQDYGTSRISKISFFGKAADGEYFANLGVKEYAATGKESAIPEILNFYKMYTEVIGKSYVKSNYKMKKAEFIKLFVMGNENMELAAKLVHKIQGLAMMHFFVKNKKDVNSIMTDLILAAKKVGKYNPVFLKIY